MAARSVTRITVGDTVAGFYLFEGSPEYQVPRIGQFLLRLHLTGHALTVGAWREFAETTAQGGPPVVAAEEMTAAELDDIPSEIDHLYVLNLTAEGFSFAHYRADRDPWAALGRWAVQGEADNLGDVLALAVRYAEAMARRARRADWVSAETRTLAEQWAAAARNMVLVHQADEGEYIAPAAAELPARRDGQDIAEHAAEVGALCVERAEYLVSVAAEGRQLGLPALTAQAEREARGWTRTGHAHWLAAL
ncbi:hypothetical protein ACWF9G_22790 [Nocardia sp. NPDC055029]